MGRIMFGCATLADKCYVKALLGVVPDNFPARLWGYTLCLQEYENMPKNVKRIIDNNWTQGEFKSYFLREDPSNIIDGIAWKINEKQEEILDDWELVGLGWYNKENILITDVHLGYHHAYAYTIKDAVGKEVKDYPFKEPPAFPVDREKMLELARKNNLAARKVRGEN